jgi:hypothetical protein
MRAPPGIDSWSVRAAARLTGRGAPERLSALFSGDPRGLRARPRPEEDLWS